MFVFNRNGDGGDWPARGQYQVVRTGEKTRTAHICCPECATPLSLRDHNIKDDGHVVGVVVCPIGECGFHEFAKLEDWRNQ